MNWYYQIKISQNNLPDIWLDTPDSFEAGDMKYDIKFISINNITDVPDWNVTLHRKSMEKIFKQGIQKLPLIILEDLGNNVYELCDGVHRLAAYRNVFPEATRIKAAVFMAKK